MTPSTCPERPGGLEEPVLPEVEALLRRVVREHVAAERRRRHTPLLHVGTPGAETIHPVRLDEASDHALRADVVAAMTRRVRPASSTPLVWLTRGGLPHELQDVDADWLAGAAQAFGEAGLPLLFVVVGRHGWCDPRSGVRRSWVRLRGRP